MEYLNGPDQVIPATSLKCWTADSGVLLQMDGLGRATVPPVSVHTFVREVAERYPEQRALAVERGGAWRYWTYQEYFDESRTVAKAFIHLGLDRFGGVCIMGFNAPEWLIGNFGCIFAGGISTGIYTTNSPDACRHLAHDCKAQILVLENASHVDKFMSVRDQLPHVKAIVQWTGTPTAEGVMSWEDLLVLGRKQTDDLLNDRLKRQAVNQCCTLIYTSGTTGPPKGVMCSQDNLTWVGRQRAELASLVDCKESVVSYLPLSHLAAQLIDIYITLPAATTVFFARPDALKGSLGNTLKEALPTGFFGVPRVWEKIHEKMLEAGKASGGLVKMVAGWARAATLSHHMAIVEGRAPSMYQRVQYGLARTLVLDRVKAVLGLGCSTNLVSAGAPLAADVLEFFLSLDLPIVEGYGLSESLSVATQNMFQGNHWKAGTVGKVVDDMTEMKIFDSPMANPLVKGEGELCFKGRNVFMGYLNLEAKTHEAITDDGWLHTGDLGWMDDDGFVYISGRAKELIITAGGENIPPFVIEEAIKKELPIISNAMVCGDKRKYLTVLLTIKCAIDEESGQPLEALTKPVVKWCAAKGAVVATVAELRRHVAAERGGAIGKEVQAAIDRYNKNAAISNAQKVQRWSILPHDFTLATGELNNTLKLKRSVAASMYAKEIEMVYSDDYPVGC